MSRVRIFIIGAAAAALSACETVEMNEETCAGADWRALGYADGRNSESELKFAERRAQCSAFSIAADEASYRAGRDSGLAALCAPGEAFPFAESGGIYRGGCPAAVEQDFLTDYVTGRHIFRLREAREAAQSQLSSASTSLNSYRYSIETALRTLADTSAEPKALERAQRNLRSAREAIPRAEAELGRATYELGRADEALDRALATTAEFPRSDLFEFIFPPLVEAHLMARLSDDIVYCHDDTPAGAPECRLADGPLYFAAADAGADSGPACFVGPGLARTQNRSGRPRTESARWTQNYELFAMTPEPERPDRLRTARAPSGGFYASFQWSEGSVRLSDMGCAGRSPAE